MLVDSEIQGKVDCCWAPNVVQKRHRPAWRGRIPVQWQGSVAEFRTNDIAAAQTVTGYVFLASTTRKNELRATQVNHMHAT